MKRIAIAVAAFVAPIIAWAAYNQIPPGALAINSLGTNVYTYLLNAADSATGFISGNALGTGVQTALGIAADQPGGVLQLNNSGYIPIGIPQIGITNGSSAAVGNIGEVISSDIAVGSAVSLTSVTPANITSVSLTAGDWDCHGDVQFTTGGTTVVVSVAGWISTTSAASPGNPEAAGLVRNYTPNTAGISPALAPGEVRISVSGTTPTYLEATSNFNTSTNAGYGLLSCRRVR